MQKWNFYIYLRHNLQKQKIVIGHKFSICQFILHISNISCQAKLKIKIWHIFYIRHVYRSTISISKWVMYDITNFLFSLDFFLWPFFWCMYIKVTIETRERWLPTLRVTVFNYDMNLTSFLQPIFSLLTHIYR